MYADTENLPIMARLHAALDSLEASRDLIRQVREVKSFRTEQRELRSAADLVAEARSLVLRLLDGDGR